MNDVNPEGGGEAARESKRDALGGTFKLCSQKFADRNKFAHEEFPFSE